MLPVHCLQADFERAANLSRLKTGDDFSRHPVHFPAPHRARRASSEWRIGLRLLTDVDERFHRAWLDLEQQASSRNPFQSASYVLAAARHLPEVAAPLILTVECQGELQSLCVFENVAATRRLPVRHLRAWQTPHTYFDTPLLRTGSAERSMEVFWDFLLRGSHDWHGVEFPRFPNHDAVSRIFEGTAQAEKIPCLKGLCWERASLNFRECAEQDVMQHLSVKRMKSLRRGWRELEKLGDVRFEVQHDPHQMAQCAEELMHLESLGWKSTVGTALASQASHQQFFREMVAGFTQQQDVFFTRITVNGQAIVSVAHLKAHDTAYAFKMGWNPATERGCPGFQIKLQTVHQRSLLPAGIQQIDSCSSPGSFIEHVWPHRRSFCNRVYVTSPVGNLTATMVSGLRWMRDTSRAVSRRLFHSNSEDSPETPRNG